MKISKIIIALTFFIACINLFSQTKRVAHKSHSGTDLAFNTEGEDNFGIVPGHLENFKRIDSIEFQTQRIIIQYMSAGKKQIIDTLIDDPFFSNPEVSLDSMQNVYPEVKFIGMDKRDSQGNPKTKVKQDGAYFFNPGNPWDNDRTGLLAIFITVTMILFTFFSWKVQNKKLGMQGPEAVL